MHTCKSKERDRCISIEREREGEREREREKEREREREKEREREREILPQICPIWSLFQNSSLFFRGKYVPFDVFVLEHTELPAKLLHYFLRSNKSNISELSEGVGAVTNEGFG